MANTKLLAVNFVKNNVLNTNKPTENHGESTAGKPQQALLSLVPNSCSLPKNVIQDIEKIEVEKHLEINYQQLNEKLIKDLATLTCKSLMIEYKSEYSAWKNSKNRAKKMQGIVGTKFDAKFNAFPSFLKLVGPKSNIDDSLDRIDPEYGYTDGNVRWASKQLQSENRKVVQEYEVNGSSVTLTKLAKSVGIKYDALRMQMKRGRPLADILKQHYSDKPPVKKYSKSVSECPFPEGKEAEWEEHFKKEASSLCPHNPKSRCHYFATKCMQKLHILRDECEGYGYDKLPDSLLYQCEYWSALHKEAVQKLNLAIYQERYIAPLGPSQEELEMRQYLGL